MILFRDMIMIYVIDLCLFYLKQQPKKNTFQISRSCLPSGTIRAQLSIKKVIKYWKNTVHLFSKRQRYDKRTTSRLKKYKNQRREHPTFYGIYPWEPPSPGASSRSPQRRKLLYPCCLQKLAINFFGLVPKALQLKWYHCPKTDQ